MKFLVYKMTSCEVIVEAASEEEAIQIAQNTESELFNEPDADWDVREYHGSEEAINDG